MNKLTFVHIIIIGIVVAAIVAGAMYWFMLKPKKEDTDSTLAAAASTRDNGGTQEKINQKIKELHDTEKKAAETEAKWNVNVVKYMPQFPYTDKTNALDLYFAPEVGRTSKGKMYGFRDIPTVWGEWVTDWYKKEEKYGVVRDPSTVFPIPQFDTDPNKLPATLANHLTFPSDGKTWPVRLTCKSLDDALEHLKRFNKSMVGHGMPVINNVALSGHSPDLIMSYDLALYVIPRSGPPVQEPMINGGTGAAAGPGGPPSMPMMGAPSSMGAPGGKAGRAD